MATMDATSTNTALPEEVGTQLSRAQKKIDDLLEDIGRLSDELRRKDSMLTTPKSRLPVLSGWLETSLTGELQQRSSAATPVDTVLWEPSSSTCQRPSCSTPSNRSDRGRTWTEVVVQGRQRAPGDAPPSLGVSLTNKYSVLFRSEEPDGVLEQSGASSPSGALPPLTDNTAFPPLTAACALADGRPASARSPPSSAQRRRLLRDAVRLHSRRSPRRVPQDHQAAYGENEFTESATERATTLVIGDSIIRNVRLSGALTLSFPGATVTDIAEKLTTVLDSEPQINRVVIHVGTNDICRH